MKGLEDDLSGVDRWEAQCGGRWIRLGLEKGMLRRPLSADRLQEGEEIKVWATRRVGAAGAA